ncbi:hypothetical protein AX15_004313 [Amanita polypyramis BW_CC]|nr:hypothetical protein AX15_004313 [Amanita polypyramis BW_CC]
MAPIRTRGERPSTSGKNRRIHGESKVQRRSDTLPGVQKIKASLRQTRRLLAKDNLAADVRVETERRLKALERDLEKAEIGRKERTLAIKYHRVKFFERQKIVRRIAQTKKQITSANGDTGHLESNLFDLRVDMNYILHYPKTRKYVSLFPPEIRKGESRDEAETTRTDIRRQEIRSWIRERMKTGELPTVPEDNTSSKVVGITATDFHGPGRGGGKKGKTAITKPADDIERDIFFGDDEDEDEASDSGGE